MDYDKMFKIDVERLDQEALQQPMYYYEISEAYAAAKFERDQAVDQLALLEAQLYSGIVQGYDKKPSDTFIQKEIVQDDEYQALKRRVGELNKELALWQGRQRALEEKRTSIETLTKLYLGNYFCVPNTPQAREQDSAEIVGSKKLSDNPRLNKRS